MSRTSEYQCPVCARLITDSIFRIGGGRLYKSCPSCSGRTGEHMLYTCPGSFGYRKKATGEPFIQSYCTRCRGNQNAGPYEGGIPCSDANAAGLHPVKSVRILPVIRSEFGGAEDFDGFLTDVLPSRGYRYYFKTGMRDAAGALVLFQNEGRLRGCALIKEAVRVPEGVNLGTSHYNGYYELYPDTLTIFDEPVDTEQMESIVPGFTGFNQSKKVLDVGILPMILDRPSLSAEPIGTVIPEEVSEPTGTFNEGAVKRVRVNAYERNPKARRACIEHYAEDDGRIRCQICGFEFSERYGEALIGMIHIHHLVEISSIREQYEVDPEKDLIPVCPNCHAVIHSRNPPYTPDEVREMIRLTHSRK